MKYANYKNILRGVSTLDVTKKHLIAPFLLIIFTALSANIFGRGGHSTLDLVDPSFNPYIQTSSFGFKWVNQIQALPDGKILAIGGFNSYNRVPTGKLVRLNPDGSLDATFNNQTITDVTSFDIAARIIIHPHGKIVLKGSGIIVAGQPPKLVLRLNADGTVDPTFNYAQTGFIYKMEMDSLGRFVLSGDIATPNGTRRMVRLNPDGSLDASFSFMLPAGTELSNLSLQGNKIVVLTTISSNRQIYRVNEDGSTDVSFTPLAGTSLSLAGVQPNNKILYQNSLTLLRLNENGGSDETFQATALTQVINPLLLKYTRDGKIFVTTSSSPATFKRYLVNGGVDPSFNQYTTTFLACYALLPDDSIVVGDGVMGGNGGFSNKFLKLTPAGMLDTTFNPGGIGFQNILPGIIEAIESQPDGKVLLGGRFDLINGTSSYRLGRLNTDSTLDASFQLNTSGTGNYFSLIRDVYQIHVRADGKIIVSGFFDYVLNGDTKRNM